MHIFNINNSFESTPWPKLTPSLGSFVYTYALHKVSLLLMQFDLFNHDVFIVPTQKTESDHVMFLFKILLVLYSFCK